MIKHTVADTHSRYHRYNTKKINVLVILRSKAAREFTTTSTAKGDRFVHKFVVILNKNTVIFYKIPATKEFKNDKYTVYTETDGNT